MFRELAAILAMVSMTGAVGAQPFAAGKLIIEHPWSRPTAAGMPVGVAYFSITNRGSVEDTLVAASTPVAASVEMHQSTISDGMARMRPLAQIAIGPGKTVKVEPGGIHLMLMDLKQPLIAGQRVPLTLEFRVAGKVTVQLAIEASEAPPSAGQ